MYFLNENLPDDPSSGPPRARGFQEGRSSWLLVVPPKGGLARTRARAASFASGSLAGVRAGLGWDAVSPRPRPLAARPGDVGPRAARPGWGLTTRRPPGDSAPNPPPPRPPTHSMPMSHLGDALPALALANTYVAAARGRGAGDARRARGERPRARSAAPRPARWRIDRNDRTPPPARTPHAVPAHRPAPRGPGPGPGPGLTPSFARTTPSGSASADPPPA